MIGISLPSLYLYFDRIYFLWFLTKPIFNIFFIDFFRFFSLERNFQNVETENLKDNTELTLNMRKRVKKRGKRSTNWEPDTDP